MNRQLSLLCMVLIATNTMCLAQNYSFTDMKVVFPKAGVAVVTYKARVDSSAAGQDTSGAYNAASVWTKRWGNWVLISHAFIKSQ